MYPSSSHLISFHKIASHFKIFQQMKITKNEDFVFFIMKSYLEPELFIMPSLPLFVKFTAIMRLIVI